MADEIPPTPPAEKPLTDRQKAALAWANADTAEKKSAAVKDFSVLREIYSEAQNY